MQLSTSAKNYAVAAAAATAAAALAGEVPEQVDACFVCNPNFNYSWLENPPPDTYVCADLTIFGGTHCEIHINWAAQTAECFIAGYCGVC